MKRRAIAGLLTRWAAGLSGLLLVGLVLFIVIGESIGDGPPPLRVFASPVWIGMMLAIGGMLVGWRRERLGGMLVVCGAALMFGYELIAHGGVLGGLFPFIVAPGVLLLLSDRLSRHRGPACDTQPVARVSG